MSSKTRHKCFDFNSVVVTKMTSNQLINLIGYQAESQVEKSVPEYDLKLISEIKKRLYKPCDKNYRHNRELSIRLLIMLDCCLSCVLVAGMVR